jgi:hypothetical protein
MLIEYHPSHLNLSAVLSFHDSLLLRNTRDEELLINTVLKAKLIERGISELGLIIIVNEMLIIQPQG